MKNFNISQFLFSFKGRVNRKPYWLFSLGLGISIFIISILIQAFLNFQGKEITPEEFKNIMNIIALLFLWPALAVQIKRWHDINKSGWFVLVSFIPFVGFLITVIVNGFFEGTYGENKYGQDPVHRDPSEIKKSKRLEKDI